MSPFLFALSINRIETFVPVVAKILLGGNAQAVFDQSLVGRRIAAIDAPASQHSLIPIAKIVPWYYWLTAHAALHGAAIVMVLRLFGYVWNVVVILAFAELIIHALIDDAEIAEHRFF